MTTCKACAKAMEQRARACPGCGAPNKRGRVVLWIALGVMALVVVAGVAGDRKKKGKAAADARPPTSATVPAAPTKPAVKAAPIAVAPLDVTALDLIEAYKENEINADDKYKGKIVRVTGKVGRIAKDILDDPYVILATSLGDIQAMVGTEAKVLRRGQQATLRCTCGGLSLGTVLLKDCVLE